MGLDYCRERIATYYRISLDELLREQRAPDRAGRDDVPNDRLRLSMGRWELIGQRLLAAQGVSKLEILGFSGVTSPFPKGYEANTERSDESTFSLTGRGGRFDTVWAKTGR